MQRPAVDHAVPLEIHGDNRVIEPSLPITRHLASVTRVMEKTHTSGLGDQPVHGGHDVVCRRIEGGVGWVVGAVGQLDHAAGLSRVAPRDEELGHVGHIVDAALQLMLGANVVDPNQQCFPSAHDWSAVVGGRRHAKRTNKKSVSKTTGS